MKIFERRMDAVEQSRKDLSNKPQIVFRLPKMMTMENWNETVNKVKETANKQANEPKGATK